MSTQIDFNDKGGRGDRDRGSYGGERNFGGDRSRGSYGGGDRDRGSYGGGDRDGRFGGRGGSRGDSRYSGGDEVTDPRFAGKFGGSHGDLPRGPASSYGGREENSSSGTAALSIQNLTSAAQEAEAKKAEDAKIAKEALKAQKELERLALNEKKEAALKTVEEQKAAFKAAAAAGKEAATVAYATGKKGVELNNYISSMSTKPTGAEPTCRTISRSRSEPAGRPNDCGC